MTKSAKLPQFADDLKRELKNKSFRKAFEEETRRLEIALEIIRLRKKMAVTQKDLARRLKTNQSAIARIESGNENATIETLDRIARAFNKKLSIRFV